jgi:hypothetical protein
MLDIRFDEFREAHPEYPESLRSHYSQSFISDIPMVMQNSFYVDLEEPKVIDLILSVGMPEYIYCGDQETIDELGKAYPQLSPLIRFHGWYQNSIYMVMHTSIYEPEAKIAS